MEFIPYGKQDISKSDIQSVVDVLKSDFLTQGPVVSQFEQSLSQVCNVQNAIAVNSATSALHIACLALGLSDGDIAWTSPITFVATANAARLCGAAVDFVDIDSKTYNLCPEKLKEKLVIAERKNSLPKVVIPVHFAGQSCDMEKIHQLSKKYNFKIIEDASHAIGGQYKKLPIGSCQFSDITVFSFHPVKIITTGEGGVATTNSMEVAKKMRLFASHYVSRDPEVMLGESDGPWYYQQVGLGLNYRMTDIQAALGLSQVKRLDQFVLRRHELASEYESLLRELPVELPFQSSDSYSSLHLFPVKVNNRLEVYKHMLAKKIGVNVHYIPVHTQPYYRKFGFSYGDYPVAEEYYSKTLTLPLHQGLSGKHLKYIVKSLGEVL
jgi:UDP-4-amino-4,6-dideoxy-N-acetyl-beta-L-altrosamine transaminase